MKTMRLVVGIISMSLVLIIMFQSCVAGVGNAISGNEETSGFSGIFLSVCFLIAGAVGVATHRIGSGGAITSIIFYTIGGLVGIFNYGSFGDLQIWSILGFIFALLYLISIIKKKNQVNL